MQSRLSSFFSVQFRCLMDTQYINYGLNGHFHPQLLDTIDTVLLYVPMWTRNNVSLNR